MKLWTLTLVEVFEEKNYNPLSNVIYSVSAPNLNIMKKLYNDFINSTGFDKKDISGFLQAAKKHGSCAVKLQYVSNDYFILSLAQNDCIK